MTFVTEITVFVVLPVLLVVGLVTFCNHRSSAPFQYTVEIIEGCEYLRFPTHYHTAITHKGNCKNH